MKRSTVWTAVCTRVIIAAVLQMKPLTALRCASIGLLIVSTVYTAWYMQLGSIFENSGALSTIGLEHRLLFAVWGVLAQGAMIVNIETMYRSAGISLKFYKILLIASTVGIGMTLVFPFDYDLRAFYVLHCTGAFLFTGANSGAILAYFILRRKVHPAFWVLFGLGCAVLAASLILLLITKETAFNETLPLFGAFALFAATNATKLGIQPAVSENEGTKQEDGTEEKQPAHRA